MSTFVTFMLDNYYDKHHTTVYKHRQSNYCTQLIIMVSDESIIDFTLFKLTATI